MIYITDLLDAKPAEASRPHRDTLRRDDPMFLRGSILAVIGLLFCSLGGHLGPAGRFVLVWTGLAFVAVGIAYAFGWRGVFGKRPDGGLSLAHVVPLAPFLGLAWSSWWLARTLLHEPTISVVTPHLRLARRLLAHELPDDVDHVVDLTAEFPSQIRGPRYFNLPTLDGCTPDPGAMRRILDAIPRNSVTLVHCAQGHGRTATFAACFLVDHAGLSAEAAAAKIFAARPLTRMNRDQRAFLERFAAITEQTRSPDTLRT